MELLFYIYFSLLDNVFSSFYLYFLLTFEVLFVFGNNFSLKWIY